MHIAKILRSGTMALAIGVTACGGDGGRRSEAQWQAVSDTVGDTVTVRTLSGSLWGDTAYLEAEVTIGMMDGPDEYLIGDPRSIAVGDDGVIYMLDRQVPVIRSYGPDGMYLRDIGREGGGPGEYKNPGSMATLADGRLLVRDPGNGRLSLFGPEGEYLEQLWYPGGFNTSRRLYRDTAGYVHSMVLLNYGTAPWDWEFGLARIDPDAGIVDTVAVPTWDHEVSRITGSREGGGSSSNRVPFTAQVHWSFSPLGYMVGGVSNEYRIDLYRATESVLRIEREWTPVPVKREEAEEHRRRATHNMRQQYPGWKWNGPPVPDSKPPFRGMFVSAEGNLWILVPTDARVSVTEAEAREEEQRTGWPQIRHTEPPAYDVFDRDGRFLGHVRVPHSFQTYPEPVVRGDYVWAVTRDELDVASIVRFRLVLPDRP
jgi:hypothetical protein